MSDMGELAPEIFKKALGNVDNVAGQYMFIRPLGARLIYASVNVGVRDVLYESERIILAERTINSLRTNNASIRTAGRP